MIQFTLGRIHFFSTAQRPLLQVQTSSEHSQNYRFTRVGSGREPEEALWLAEPAIPVGQTWQFRIKLGETAYDPPAEDSSYTTILQRLWLQDSQIYSYHPPPSVSPSRVIKIPKFTGSLPSRAIYIYLPRGYDEQPDRLYPVLYMHDGQNCFEAFVEDSYAGSWRADEVADDLIGQGLMQECLIVGVSNGQAARQAEYSPPYVTYRLPPVASQKGKKRRNQSKSASITGRADRMAAFYRHEIAPFLSRRYRVRTGREHTATCGSSLGGLFSLYLAWEYSDFARHHAALSPALWVTKTPQGKLEVVERLRQGSLRDIRLWLDSGTLDEPGRGDDGRYDTQAARDALLENGCRQGPDFQYYLDDGATHSEAAWAARLPLIFQFLFPIY